MFVCCDFSLYNLGKYSHTWFLKMRLLKRKEVMQITSLSNGNLYRKINAGEFPKPIPIGNRRKAWLEADVLAWIKRKVKESKAKHDGVIV